MGDMSTTIGSRTLNSSDDPALRAAKLRKQKRDRTRRAVLITVVALTGVVALDAVPMLMAKAQIQEQATRVAGAAATAIKSESITSNAAIVAYSFAKTEAQDQGVDLDEASFAIAQGPTATVTVTTRPSSLILVHIPALTDLFTVTETHTGGPFLLAK